MAWGRNLIQRPTVDGETPAGAAPAWAEAEVVSRTGVRQHSGQLAPTLGSVYANPFVTLAMKEEALKSLRQAFALSCSASSQPYAHEAAASIRRPALACNEK